MKFFNEVHRSITDPSFFEEIATQHGGRVFGYAATMWAIVVIVMTAAHFRLLSDPDEGLPAALPAAFPNMKIVAGKMEPGQAVPYTVGEMKISYLAELLSFSPPSNEAFPDSIVVVDTVLPKTVIVAENAIRLHAGSDRLRLFFGKESAFDLPYRSLVSEGETVEMTPSGIADYMSRHVLAILFNLALQHAFTTGFSLLATVILLSFLAYIARNHLTRSLSVCVRFAIYAYTPVALGSVLVALSGVRFGWIWQTSVIVSMFLIFRSTSYILRKNMPMNKKDDE